jgi:uncharacterized iron-regulated membrane protein
MNIAAPALYSASMIYVSLRDLNGQDYSPFLSIANIFFALTGVLQIVSGVYLIASVQRIRKFFTSQGGQTSFNSRTMTLHATAFGIYILAAALYFGTDIYWSFFSTPTSQEIVDFSAILFNLISFSA